MFSDSNVDISALDIPVNAVATAMKYFFSDLLVEPVIPNIVYDDLIAASSKSCMLKCSCHLSGCVCMHVCMHACMFVCMREEM